MPDLIDTYAPPFEQTVGGVTYKFPVLDMPDLAAWAREIHNQDKAAASAVVPANAPPDLRLRFLRQVDRAKPDVDVLMGAVFTPDGARRVLELSLTKGGLDKAAIPAVLKGVKPKRVFELAQEVSGLFDPAEKDAPAPAPATGNASEGGGPNSGGPAGGEGSGETS